MKKALLSLLTAVLAVAGLAKDALWTRSNTASGYWTNVVEWVDGDDQPLTEYPNGADWDVSLKSLSSGDAHTFILNLGDNDSLSGPDLENYPHEYAVKSLSGSERHTLNLYSLHSLRHNPIYFTVDNPTGFYGFWTASNPRGVLVVPVAAAATETVRHFSNERRAGIDVPTAGGTVQVDEVYGNGYLEKHGAGELVVKTTSGFHNKVNVNGGRLTLEGSAWPTAPVGDPYVWLDASVRDSLMTTEDGGRQAVTNWVDRRGGEGRPSATVPENINPNLEPHLVAFARAPFLSGETVNGHALVDFGARKAARVAEQGPTNCLLRFARGMNVGIREVFTVYRMTDYTADVSMPVGDKGYYPLHGNVNRLFHGTHADQGVKYADVAFNGNKVEPLYEDFKEGDFTRLHVVSVGHQASFTSLDLIGGDRAYVDRVGGMRIAEILYYTNRLTHLERAAVNRYLMKKWLSPADAPAEDFGFVNLASNDVEVAVATGHRATVGSLVVHGNKAIKEGDGTLAIGKLLPEDAAVEVRGGTLAFRTLPTVDSSEPAANAYLWLDATVEDSFVPQTGRAAEGPEYIEAWKDRRLDRESPKAVLPGSASTYFIQNAPWLRRAVEIPGGATRTVVDFGEKTTSETRTWMRLDTYSSDNAFEGYVAVRFKSTTSAVNLFGSTEQGMTRNERPMLVSRKFGSWKPVAGLWTVDGVPSDPWDGTHGTIDTNRFYVISLSLTRLGRFDLLAKDRLQTGSAGEVEIGEYLLYDRRLTDAERRGTIDYLMQRWEGKHAPQVNGVTTVKSLSYAADTPVALESEGPLAVEQLSGGNGIYRKGGTGAVSLGTLSGETPMNAVTVTGGSLSLAFDWADDSIFHFDAMDTASLTYEVTGSVDTGDLKTNVLTWADTRGASYELATSAKGQNACVADPTLLSVETRPGVWRPCLDFGTYASGKASAVDAAGLVMKAQHADVKEAYIVYMDTDPNRNGFIFADRSYYQYHRGGSGKMVNPASDRAWIVGRGTAYVDGEEKSPDYSLPAGFHIIAFINPNEETTYISQLSKDRSNDTSRSGGNRICEALAYNRHLSDAERTFLLQKLQAKWYGESLPTVTKSLTSLTVADGATFSAPTLNAATTRLGGTGTLSVGQVSGVTTLTTTYDPAVGAFDELTVDGPVYFAETGNLILEVPGSGKVPYGTYPILSATNLDLLDPSRFVIESDLLAARALSLKVEDNVLKLVVRPRGLTMIVK